MRRRALMMVAATCAVICGPATAASIGSPTRVHVSPARIGPATNVVVRFTQPESTGIVAGTRVIETARVNGPVRRDCVGAGSVRLATAVEGTRMHLVLRPSQLGGRWCAGRYRGDVLIEMEPDCTTGVTVHACPMWIMAPRTIADFAFRVAVG